MLARFAASDIIDETTWKQAQFMLKQRASINPRASSGCNIHRYSGIIKCAECGASLVAKRRKWNGVEYVVYTCNSNHRYGKQYCTPHSVREDQLDEMIDCEVRSLLETIKTESKKYDKIVKNWIKKKPKYDRLIKTCSDKIELCKSEIEQIIIERIGDREHAAVYNNMIEKREAEIQSLEKRIADLQKYDEVCKRRREELENTYELIERILSERRISNINLRMLVKQVTIHQNEDKSIDISFEINGSFNGSCIVEVEPEI